MRGIKYARHFPLNVSWWDLQSNFLHFSWGKRVHDDSVGRSWTRSAHEHVKCTAVCRTVHHTPAVTLHREVGSQRCDSSVRSREFKPHTRHTSTLETEASKTLHFKNHLGMHSETAEWQRTANPRSRNTVIDSLDPKGYQQLFQQKHHGPEGSSRCTQGSEK